MKDDIIFNIIHNIFDLRDTEVVIRIILILLKRADGLNHNLNNARATRFTPIFGTFIFFSILHCVVLLCFVCRRPVSCGPNVGSVSGLSILDCPFRFLKRLFWTKMSLPIAPFVIYMQLTEHILILRIYFGLTLRKLRCERTNLFSQVNWFSSVNVALPCLWCSLKYSYMRWCLLWSRASMETSSNNKTLNARLLARVIKGCHYT